MCRSRSARRGCTARRSRVRPHDGHGSRHRRTALPRARGPGPAWRRSRRRVRRGRRAAADRGRWPRTGPLHPRAPRCRFGRGAAGYTASSWGSNCEVEEARASSLAEPIAAGRLVIGPPCRQVTGGHDLVVDDCPVTGDRTDDRAPLVAQDRNQPVQLASGEIPRRGGRDADHQTTASCSTVQVEELVASRAEPARPLPAHAGRPWPPAPGPPAGPCAARRSRRRATGSAPRPPRSTSPETAAPGQTSRERRRARRSSRSPPRAPGRRRRRATRPCSTIPKVSVSAPRGG